MARGVLNVKSTGQVRGEIKYDELIIEPGGVIIGKGVTIEVLAEYSSKTPGVEKILFRKITMRPGATWTLTEPAQSLCQGTKGELEAVDHTSGKTIIHEVGDRWDTTPGHNVTLTN